MLCGALAGPGKPCLLSLILHQSCICITNLPQTCTAGRRVMPREVSLEDKTPILLFHCMQTHLIEREVVSNTTPLCLVLYYSTCRGQCHYQQLKREAYVTE